MTLWKLTSWYGKIFSIVYQLEFLSKIYYVLPLCFLFLFQEKHPRLCRRSTPHQRSPQPNYRKTTKIKITTKTNCAMTMFSNFWRQFSCFKISSLFSTYPFLLHCHPTWTCVSTWTGWDGNYYCMSICTQQLFKSSVLQHIHWHGKKWTNIVIKRWVDGKKYNAKYYFILSWERQEVIKEVLSIDTCLTVLYRCL